MTLITTFLSNAKFLVGVEGQLSSLGEIHARRPQGFVLPPPCTICLSVLPRQQHVHV